MPVLVSKDEPTLSPGLDDGVTIRIRAITLDDTGTSADPSEPVVPHLDYGMAGEIVSVGRAIKRHRVGGRVGVLPGSPVVRHGKRNEFADVAARFLIQSPEKLSDPQVAALWSPHLLAYGALIEVGRVKRGQSVVVTGAEHRVGLAAIQTARAVGAIPFALTASSLGCEQLSAQGAAGVASYTDFAAGEAFLPGVAHAAMDGIGGQEIEALAKAMHSRGVIVLYGKIAEATPFPADVAIRNGISLRGLDISEVVQCPQTRARAEGFISRGIAAGVINPLIDRVFPLDDAIEAQHYLGSRQAIGSVVLLA